MAAYRPLFTFHGRYLINRARWLDHYYKTKCEISDEDALDHYYKTKCEFSGEDAPRKFFTYDRPDIR